MSDNFHNFDPRPRTPGTPPARTGSQPITFAPAPFATRPNPPYPQRLYCEVIDPASARRSNRTDSILHESPDATAASELPAPIEQRAGSEPYTGWRRQNVEVDTRRISIPPALEVAPLTFRERLPYPVRTMDEMTTWMPPPVVAPRGHCSLPITRAEMRAVGSHTRDDWGGYGWAHENDPREFPLEGHDRSHFVIFGGREDPNETAAVPNADVAESIEVEGDPLIALRQAINTAQTVIRRELERRVLLEDAIRAFTQSNYHLQRSREEADRNLRVAERDRDRLRRERDLARNQAETLQGELEARQRHGPAQQEAHGNGSDEDTDLEGSVEELEQTNRWLRDARDSANDRVHRLIRERTRLQAERYQLEFDRDGLELERNHYQEERDRLENNQLRLETEMNHYRTERDREQYQNQILQAQLLELNNRLVAAQTVAHVPSDIPSPPPASTYPVVPPQTVEPPLVPPLVNPPPAVVPPDVERQTIAPPAGSSRGGRGGRGRGGAVTRRRRGGRRDGATREQPKRACKVVKGYRD